MRSVVLTGTAVLLVTTLPAASSLASCGRTWTVTPGGTATATSGKITLTDTKTGKVGTCAASKVAGSVKAGSGLPGRGIGAVTAGRFMTCTGPYKVALTVTARALPWRLNFLSYDPRTGVVRGTVSHVTIVISGRACHAVVSGTSGRAGDGVVTGAYSDRTGTLTFRPAGGDLHYWHVRGPCTDLIHSGDPVALSASYTITPRQEITSP